MQDQQPYSSSYQSYSQPQVMMGRGSKHQASFFWSDPTQIAANAQGEVTPEQRRLITMPLFSPYLRTFVVLIVLSVFIAVFLYGAFPAYSRFAFLVAGIPFIFLVLSIARSILYNRAMLGAPGLIVSAQGEVIWQDGRWVIRTYERELKVLRRNISLPSPGPYHFYYLENSGILLSAQPISTTTGMLSYPDMLAGTGLSGIEQARLALQEAFYSTLHFTQYDLECNRAGTLSPDQLGKLSRHASSRIWGELIMVPGGIAVIVCAVMFWSANFLAILFGLALSGLALYALIISEPRKRSEIQRAAVTYKDSYVRPHKVSGDSDSGPRYYYIVDDLRFKVSEAAYRALIGNTLYRVYYLPYAKALVSIEPLEASPRG